MADILTLSPETMNTLNCTLQPSTGLARASTPWTPQTITLFPITALKQKPLQSTIKAQASSKQIDAPSNDGNKHLDKKEVEQEEELPESLLERIFFRILFFVGVPMGIGFGFLYVFGNIMEQKIVNIPLWVPFLTTLTFFGASTLGIAYGALSTSWDADREGSFLGWEEAQKNWADMWREEEQSSM